MGKRILTYIVYSFILSLTSVSTWAQNVPAQPAPAQQNMDKLLDEYEKTFQSAIDGKEVMPASSTSAITCDQIDSTVENFVNSCRKESKSCSASQIKGAIIAQQRMQAQSQRFSAAVESTGASHTQTAAEASDAGATATGVNTALMEQCSIAADSCNSSKTILGEIFNSSSQNFENGKCLDRASRTLERAVASIDSNVVKLQAAAAGNFEGITIGSRLSGAGAHIAKVIKGDAGWQSAAFYGAAAVGVYKWNQDSNRKKRRKEGEQYNGSRRFSSDDGASETCFTQVNGEVGKCFADADLVSLCDGLTQSSANYQNAMKEYGASSLDMLCTSANVNAARAGTEASGDGSGSGSGETCDSSSPTYYTTSGCTNQMLSTCTSDINYGDCGKFYEDYCLNSGARGAGSNFCVYQASKDYCNLAGTSAASPACGWVNYIANNVAICGANLEQYACYPAQLTQAEYSQQCSNLGVGSTDPLCANLDNTTFNTAWRNPATPSSATASGTAVAGSDASLVNDTNSIGQTELPTNDVATNDFCAIPDNFYNPNCLNSFCGNPQNSTSPICVEYQGVSNAIQASSSPSRSVASVLPADIQAVRTGSLLDADGSGITARMCRAGLLADCGPLAGVR